MTALFIRNTRDISVSQLRPTKPIPAPARMRLAAAGGTPSDERFTYLYWGKPYPAGATIAPSFLRIWNSSTQTGTVTVTVQPTTAPWSTSRTVYTGRPGIRTGVNDTFTVTKTAAPANTMWEFDITRLLQSVANGGPWSGVRISVNGTTARMFHASASEVSELQPEIEVNWFDNPEQPDNLNPANNRAVGLAKPVLTFDFTDVGGDTSLAAAQVQIDATPSFQTPVFDSGWLNVTVPEIDLSTTAYAGLANNASAWWRVKVRDGAGLESVWSQPVQFKRVDKGVLAIVNPADAPNNFISDTSPPIIWTLTGATQVAYQVVLRDAQDATKVWYNSGKVTGTTTSITLPNKTLRNMVDQYLVSVRVWDNVDRVQTPNETLYYRVDKIVDYRPSATVAGVTGVSVAQTLPWPWVDVTWSRSTAPDSFTVWRDGEVVEDDLAPVDLFVSGTTYTYRDRGPAPRVSHIWQVTANVNQANSSMGSGFTYTTRTGSTWLMRPDTSSPILILKSASEPTPAVDAMTASMQEVHQPIGGGNPVLVTQFIRGFEGHVDGVLSDDAVPGLSARAMKLRFKDFKRHPGEKLLLYMVDELLTIVPYNLTYRPRAKSGGKIIYDISFDFFETE